MIAQRRMYARMLRAIGEETQRLSIKLRTVDQDAARDVSRAAMLLRGAAERVGRPTYGQEDI